MLNGLYQGRYAEYMDFIVWHYSQKWRVSVYTVFQNNRTPETFYYNFAKIDLISIKNWYTRPACDVIKLQYYETYITKTASKLKCARQSLQCTWLHLDFSIIVNFELVQTINDKRKYKLQQLFEMLSLGLDTGLESFYPLVNSPVNDGQFEISRDLKQSLLQFSQVACCALLHGAVVAMKTMQLALNLYQAFQTQSIHN